MFLFIYGTLKRGFYNHSVLKNAKFIANVTTCEKYPLFKLKEPYPYLQNNKGVGKIIHGELYFIEEKYISNIDAFEGAPNLYHRDKITVLLDGEKIPYATLGLRAECWTYFKTKEECLMDLVLLTEFI